MTDDLVATYRVQGLVLAFAEEVMRYDLAHALPTPPTPDVVYHTWDAQSRLTFFAVYEEALRERPGFPGWSAEERLHWVAGDPTFRPDLSFFATIRGEAVGFVTNAESEEDPQRAGSLIQVCVSPRWRGQGLGAALTLRSLQAWRADSKQMVVLHVNTQ